MARKDKKFNFIYKITNTKNNRYYIGMHSTDDLNDGYMGGGIKIKNSIKKYGRENHTKEIIEFLPTRKRLAERESQIVNEELINDPLCMNISLGGTSGGFINEEHLKKCCTAGNQAFREKLKNPEYKKEFIKKTKVVELCKTLHQDGRAKYDTFSGRSHSEEAKKSIGIKNSVHQSGESNSQFGKIWVRNLETSESIKIDQNDLERYQSLGWERGRIIDVPRKLTEEIVRGIKIKLLEGWDCVKISELFSTTPSTVKAIKCGNSWSHVKL